MGAKTQEKKGICVPGGGGGGVKNIEIYMYWPDVWVPPTGRALKLYPSKYPKVKEIRIHPNTKVKKIRTHITYCTQKYRLNL